MVNASLLKIKKGQTIVYPTDYGTFQKTNKWKIVITTLCGASLISGIIILFVIGADIYKNERPKELMYVEGECQVQSSGYKQYYCYKRSKPICYAPIWHIRFVENQTINATIIGHNRFSSLSDAIKKANEYQINASYSCWYNHKNPLEVQWEKPNSRNGLILLICGGLTVIPTIISFFLMFKYCKEINKKNRQ